MYLMGFHCCHLKHFGINKNDNMLGKERMIKLTELGLTIFFWRRKRKGRKHIAKCKKKCV